MGKENGRSGRMTRTATCMKVITKMIKKMELDFSHGSPATTTKDATKVTRDMDTVKCSGRMVAAIKVSGPMVFKMEQAGWSSLMAE